MFNRRVVAGIGLAAAYVAEGHYGVSPMPGVSQTCYAIAHTYTSLFDFSACPGAGAAHDKCVKAKLVEIREQLLETDQAFQDCHRLNSGGDAFFCYNLYKDELGDSFQETRQKVYATCQSGDERCKGKVWSELLKMLSPGSLAALDKCQSEFGGDTSAGRCFEDIMKPAMAPLRSDLLTERFKWYHNPPVAANSALSLSAWLACRAIFDGGSSTCVDLVEAKVDAAHHALCQGLVDAALSTCKTQILAMTYDDMSSKEKELVATCQKQNFAGAEFCYPELTPLIDEGLQKCGACSGCMRKLISAVVEGASSEDMNKYQACAAVIKDGHEGACLRHNIGMVPDYGGADCAAQVAALPHADCLKKKMVAFIVGLHPEDRLRFLTKCGA